MHLNQSYCKQGYTISGKTTIWAVMTLGGRKFDLHFLMMEKVLLSSIL